jgi:hypothetical protein
MLGLDFAGGRPGAAAIKAAGYHFVCRYLSPGGSGLPGKLLLPGEYEEYMSSGVAVVANWETTSDRSLGGYAAGVADAQAARATCIAVGHPELRPIYFSVDFDASPSQQGAIDDYLRGAASVLGGPDRIGVYGSYYVCQRCAASGTAQWFWQCGAWSGGQRWAGAHIYQRIGFATIGGVQCDVNEALAPDFGHAPYSGPVTMMGRRRSRRRDEENTVQLPATTTRLDMQVPTDVIGGWCGAANLLLTANTGGATVYGVYAVSDRGATPPLVVPLANNDRGQPYNQWWPLKLALAAGVTSVIVNYTAPAGMVAHIEYQN